MRNKQVKRHVLALLLAVSLVIGMAVPAVHAAGTVEIIFGQVAGKCGDQVTVPVTIINNPGIASLRFRIAYDATALTYVSTQKGGVISGGTLSSAYQTEDQELAITWFDVKNTTGDGVLFNLVFEIAETANGQYPLTVSYLPEDIVNASWQQVNCIVTDGVVQTGSNIAGTVTSFGAASGEVTIQLMQGDTEVASMVTTDGTYVLTSVAPGDYQLVVSKLNHATRSYAITVTDEDVARDMKIHLLGDINGDGRVNISDVNKANAHAAKTKQLTGYDFACADINEDGRVNISDVNKMNAHAAKTKLLW